VYSLKIKVEQLPYLALLGASSLIAMDHPTHDAAGGACPKRIDVAHDEARRKKMLHTKVHSFLRPVTITMSTIRTKIGDD
jgi:hypothetical protein